MRFLMRSLTGLFLVMMTVGLIGLGLSTLVPNPEEESGGGPPFGRGGGGGERSFTVNVSTITLGPAVPVIESFGIVDSARNLELRAARSGTLVQLSDNFRNGGRVAEGELLFAIDPTEARAALDRAQADRQDIEATLAERETALDLARDELRGAQSQRDLQQQALDRQENLLERGVGSAAAVESAALTLQQSEQTILARRQALLQAEASLNRGQTALRLAEIVEAEAQRALDETEFRAPFPGILSNANTTLGRRVTSNEQLALLIDPTALEVAFQVTTSQYGRLLSLDGTLPELPVEVRLEFGDIPIVVNGTLTRADAEVAAGQTGRLLYAQLDPEMAQVMRSGDFVTVSINEPALTRVATVPATAVSSDGRVLLVGDDNRLSEVQADILRRQGDALILQDVPNGAVYVRERQPQLGPGLLVDPVPEDGPPPPETIILDEERRARLLAFVHSNTRMPQEARARIVSALEQPEVPREIVDRLEARMER